MLKYYFMNCLFLDTRRLLGWWMVVCMGMTALACSGYVGTVDLQLVYTSDLHLNPLSEDLIKTLKISIRGDGMRVMESEFEIEDSDGAGLSDIPVGKNRVVVVAGYNSARELVSRGESLPFEIGSGDVKVFLYMSLVGRFSPPPSGLNDPEWFENYRVRMSTTRAFHDAVELPDGKVLITGGTLAPVSADLLSRIADEDASDPALRSMERFDATTAAFVTETQPADCGQGLQCLRAARAFHCSHLTSDGQLVLLTGGEPLDEGWPAEYYRVQTNSFETKEQTLPRTRHACTTISGPAGEGILVAGGMGATPETMLADVTIIGSGSSFVMPLLSLARAQARAVGLHNAVLVVGGWEQWTPRTPSDRIDYFKFDLQGNVTGSWFALQRKRVCHTAVPLKDRLGFEKVLVCGGLSVDGDGKLVVESSCEIIDPESGSSSLMEGFSEPFWGHTATVLKNGSVLLAGGFDTYGPTMLAKNYSILLNNPLENRNKKLVPMIAKRAFHTATLLPNGLVLLVGGMGGVVPPLVEMATQDYEIYNAEPSSLQSGFAP